MKMNDEGTSIQPVRNNERFGHVAIQPRNHRRLSRLVYTREPMVIRISRGERGNKRCPRQTRGIHLLVLLTRAPLAPRVPRLVTIIYNNTVLVPCAQ